MTKSLLWGLAAACSFVAAAITYANNSRPLIVTMQALAGLLMTIVAIKAARGEGGRQA